MAKHSIYPTLPRGSQVLMKVPGGDFTLHDRLVVYTSALFFVGSIFWLPSIYAWALNRLRSIPRDQPRRRAIYTASLVALTAMYVAGPHRRSKVGDLVQVRKWCLWKAWLRFFAFEVIADGGVESVKELLRGQAIVGVSPHGIFPFGLAFATLTDLSNEAFGRLRPVVASATQLIPFVRDVLKWVRAVDASRNAVDEALSQGSRIGLAPGGIAEMFEGYPKAFTHRNEEYIIIRRGIFRLAMKYNLPMIPVYCFGSTKLLKRVQFPEIVQKISLLLRVSLVLFFGQFGLPIPFRQRLLYIMGRPIYPPKSSDIADNTELLDKFVSNYCDELLQCFDRHKVSYGWEAKTLTILRI
eukprot:scaffold24618_cov127-Cylindrotheca_fusiformis.AAC.5